MAETRLLDTNERPRSDFQQLTMRVADAVMMASRWGADGNEHLADKLVEILVDEGVLVRAESPTEHELLLAIQLEMSGTVWTPDMVERIALLLNRNGYPIEPPKEK